MATGTRLVDNAAFVVAFHHATPSSATPTWVSLKGYDHCTIFLSFTNSTTVTGSAITLNQATVVAGSDTKALGFTSAWGVIDDASTSIVSAVTVTSNTFTMTAVNSKKGFYVIEVDAATLDTANKFCCLQVGIGNATAQDVTAIYILGSRDTARFAGEWGSLMNPLVD